MPSIQINGQAVFTFVRIQITERLTDEQIALLQRVESCNDAYNHCRYFTLSDINRLMEEWQQYGTQQIRAMPASAWLVGIVTQAVNQGVDEILFEDQCYHDLEEYAYETERQRHAEAALEHTEIEPGVYPEYRDRRVQDEMDGDDLPF